MQYRIEKDIPLIKKGVTDSNPPKYPFKEMEVGDSFFVANQVICGKAYLSAHAYGRYHGQRFAGRNVEGGLRIWRLEK